MSLFRDGTGGGLIEQRPEHIHDERHRAGLAPARTDGRLRSLPETAIPAILAYAIDLAS